MSRYDPYKAGMRDYERCWTLNPFKSEPCRSQWQDGYDKAEELDRAAKQAAFTERQVRFANLWNVPLRARDAFLELEDRIGPDDADAILNFVLAMSPEPDDD